MKQGQDDPTGGFAPALLAMAQNPSNEQAHDLVTELVAGLLRRIRDLELQVHRLQHPDRYISDDSASNT